MALKYLYIEFNRKRPLTSIHQIQDNLPEMEILKFYSYQQEEPVSAGLKESVRNGLIQFEENVLASPLMSISFWQEAVDSNENAKESKSLMSFLNYNLKDYFSRLIKLAKDKEIFDRIREGQPATDQEYKLVATLFVCSTAFRAIQAGYIWKAPLSTYLIINAISLYYLCPEDSEAMIEPLYISKCFASELKRFFTQRQALATAYAKL